MRIWLLIIFLEAVFVKQSFQADPGVLKVSIYYETLCPDTVEFITKQFYPAYQKIGSSLFIEFIPYGKASQYFHNNKWHFTCQHGPDECWGNKAQACGLAENKGQDKNAEFVNCVMSQPNAANEEAIEICAPKLDIAGNSLIECADGTKGDELHAYYGTLTHAIPITEIPTIVFNNFYHYGLHISATKDFLGTVCSLLINKPSACPVLPIPPPPPPTTVPCPYYPICYYCCC